MMAEPSTTSEPQVAPSALLAEKIAAVRRKHVNVASGTGAGMAVEDALVLADELARADSVPEAFAGFMQRRYERCRLVVQNSLEIGRREQRRAPVEEQTRLVEESLRVLAHPI